MASAAPLDAAKLETSTDHKDRRSTENSHDEPPMPSVVEPGDPSEHDIPPPSYGESYGRIENDQAELGTKADVGDDGRVNIRINQKSRGLSSLLVPALRSQLDLLSYPTPPSTATLSAPPDKKPPPLNIVVQIVGSRGDVQPFVALGKVLKDDHGHRVRLATHSIFREFVEENGLEFFDIGGDPSELMAFMVKNPGLMPGFDALRSGDVGKRRSEIATMIKGCWRSCIEAGDGTGVEASDLQIEDWSGTDTDSGPTGIPKPFVADAIIANPPSFAHVHCAERLGIPLHIMFTMPWSPTQAFPHPLANIQSSNADPNVTNYLSYAVVDMMTWQGLGDIINRFRQKCLALEPTSLVWAPGMLSRLKIPHTYCWSPALIPKPGDWGPHISISGFNFLSLGATFKPEADLAAFLDAGAPPLYIGFGSIVVDDPNAMTNMIFEAVKATGQRALVSKGWGGLGVDQLGIPEGVFMLGNVPHDWLFQRVSCVVHHGGAGTTAAGIKAGKPTVIVPFFGDQAFWGTMVAKAGAGPMPMPYKTLTAQKLAAAIKQALLPASQSKAKALSAKMEHEKGSEAAARSFLKALAVDKLRCVLAPKRTAVWRVKRTDVRLSAFAAAVLGNSGLLNPSDLKLYRPHEYETDDGPWDPITGGASAVLEITTSLTMGVADLPVKSLKALGIYPDPNRPRSSSRSSTKSLKRASSTAGSPSLEPHTDDKLITTVPSTEQSVIRASDIPNVSVAHDDQHLSPSSPIAREAGRSSSPSGEAAAIAHAVGDQMVQPPTSPTSPAATGRSRSGSNASQNQNGQDNQFDLETAIGTGRGVSRMVTEGLKTPLNFTLSLAQGFHNAPKLYGDDTVRKQEKITGLTSGLRVAGKGFGYGMYDGITGLVTQPISGAKKEGAVGFVKGVGKGLAGIVLKPHAAAFGVAGYTLKGMYKELVKKSGASIDNYIIASRTAMGYEDLKNSTVAERQDVISRWRDLRIYLKKKKHTGEETLDNVKEKVERTRERAASKSWGSKQADLPPAVDSRNVHRVTTFDSIDTGIYSFDDEPLSQHEDSLAINTEAEDAEFEEAIQRSVTETSRGNAEEDALIERAIRATVAEIELAKARGADEAELHNKMQERIRAAQSGLFQPDAISESSVGTSGVHDDDRDSGIVMQGDEEVDLARAVTASRSDHAEKEAAEAKAKHEEDVVMQYMIKQSLMEEELRQKQDESKAATGSNE